MEYLVGGQRPNIVRAASNLKYLRVIATSDGDSNPGVKSRIR